MGEYASGQRRRLSVLGITSCCLALAAAGAAKLDRLHWFSIPLAMTAGIIGLVGLVMALGRRETEFASPIVGLVLSVVAVGLGFLALIGAGARALNAALASPIRN